MSLINDALKRAKQAQARPALAPVSEALLQPAESRHPANRSTLGLWLAVVVAALFLAGWFYRQWRASGERFADDAVGKRAVAAQMPPPPAPAPSPSPTDASPGAPPVLAPPPTPAPLTAPTPTAQIPPVTPAPAPATAAAAVHRFPSATPGDQAAPQPDTAAVGEQPGAPPAPAPPSFPTLKLQGIYYSRTKPSALINGHTLFVGDELEGARVMAIEALKVVVEFGGDTRTLSLR